MIVIAILFMILSSAISGLVGEPVATTDKVTVCVLVAEVSESGDPGGDAMALLSKHGIESGCTMTTGARTSVWVSKKNAAAARRVLLAVPKLKPFVLR